MLTSVLLGVGFHMSPVYLLLKILLLLVYSSEALKKTSKVLQAWEEWREKIQMVVLEQFFQNI